MKKSQKEAIKISRNMQNQIEEMFAGAHHEIKNLSYIITTSVELLSLSQKDQKALDMLENVQKKITLINSTLNNMRETVKDTSDEDVTQLSIKSIVDSAVGLCKRRFENHHTVLKTEIENDFVISHKKHQLIQSILSMLSSAYDSVQQTDSKIKEVTLIIRERRNKLQLVVTDSAPTLTKEEQQDIFNPIKSFKGRSGLSLLLVKDVIESNGGTFRYTSIDNKNAFIMTFHEYNLNDGTASLGLEEADSILSKCAI